MEMKSPDFLLCILKPNEFFYFVVVILTGTWFVYDKFGSPQNAEALIGKF